MEFKSAFLAGEWVVEPELNALRKNGVERHIEPKVMRVLLTLASQQNHVVTKEQLIAAVWPDTFVSDDVLTRCISILRRITEDDPQAPRFIQTVPKVGYRLVAAVQELPSPPVLLRATAPNLPPATVPPQVEALGAPASALPNRPELPRRMPPGLVVAVPTVQQSIAGKDQSEVTPGSRFALAFIAFLLLVSILAAFVWRPPRRPAPQELIFRTIPFTTYAGEQTEPAFSPDGQSIAFVRVAEDGSSRRILLKHIGNEAVTALTEDADEQFSPAWSPDGRQIAYLATSGSGLTLNLVATRLGSKPRTLLIPQQRSHWEQGALSWSPDGRSLVFPDHTGNSPNSSLFRVDLLTRHAEAITSPPPGWEGDLNPAFSPDGRRIAFTRASETAVRDIYWIDLKDNSLHQLTRDRTNLDGLAWSRDGASILFSSNRGGAYSLRSVALDGRAPERLPFGTEDSSQPAVGPLPGQLAYTQGSAIWSIDRLGHGEAYGEAVTSSTQQDSAPSLSPDGRFFAFQSHRSGNQEVWIASLTGEGLRQLTSAGGPVTGSPSWSHQGDTIV